MPYYEMPSNGFRGNGGGLVAAVSMMIARVGFALNHKKVRRIYTEVKLQVRRGGGRKRALGTRKPMVLPQLVQTSAGR